MRSYGNRVSSNSISGVCIRRGDNRHRRKMTWEHRKGTTWGQRQRLESMHLQAQEAKDARNSQNLEETGRMPLTAWEGAWPCWHLHLGLHPPKLWENTFLLFQAPWFVMTCYGSHRKSMYSKRNVSYQGFPVNARMQGAGPNHGQLNTPVGLAAGQGMVEKR